MSSINSFFRFSTLIPVSHGQSIASFVDMGHMVKTTIEQEISWQMKLIDPVHDLWQRKDE